MKEETKNALLATVEKLEKALHKLENLKLTPEQEASLPPIGKPTDSINRLVHQLDQSLGQLPEKYDEEVAIIRAAFLRQEEAKQIVESRINFLIKEIKRQKKTIKPEAAQHVRNLFSQCREILAGDPKPEQIETILNNLEAGKRIIVGELQTCEISELIKTTIETLENREAFGHARKLLEKNLGLGEKLEALNPVYTPDAEEGHKLTDLLEKSTQRELRRLKVINTTVRWAALPYLRFMHWAFLYACKNAENPTPWTRFVVWVTRPASLWAKMQARRLA